MPLGFGPVANTPEEFAARIQRRDAEMGQGHPRRQHQNGMRNRNMTSSARSRIVAASRRAGAGLGQRPGGLSEQAGADDRAVRAGRAGRPHRPAGGAEADGRFGKQFYVENHAGAGGNHRRGRRGRAPADGYKSCCTSQATVINPQPLQIAALRSRSRTSSPSRASRRRPTCWWCILGAGQDRQGAGRADPKRAGQVHGYAQPGLGTPAHLSGELFRLTRNSTSPRSRSAAAAR